MFVANVETARIYRVIALSSIAFALIACSGSEEKRLEYRQSQSVGTLEIPAGLSAPSSDAMLVLPPVNPEMVEVDPKPPVNLPEELLVQPEKVKPAPGRGFELD